MEKFSTRLRENALKDIISHIKEDCEILKQIKPITTKLIFTYKIELPFKYKIVSYDTMTKFVKIKDDGDISIEFENGKIMSIEEYGFDYTVELSDSLDNLINDFNLKNI